MSENVDYMTRAKRRVQRRFLRVACIVLALYGVLWFGGRNVARKPLDPSRLYRITRVVDGDTLELEGGARVRLIGVDTPEKWESDKRERDAARAGLTEAQVAEFGEGASRFAKDLCKGKLARIEYESTNALTKHRDRYGRYLAYVYLVDPGDAKAEHVCLNRELVRQGYARHTTYVRNEAIKKEYRELEKQARNEKRGLWKMGRIP